MLGHYFTYLLGLVGGLGKPYIQDKTLKPKTLNPKPETLTSELEALHRVAPKGGGLARGGSRAAT